MAARGAADFASFAPVLEEWVGLVREASSLIDPSRWVALLLRSLHNLTKTLKLPKLNLGYPDSCKINPK